MSSGRRVKVTEHLLTLTRGTDELLLANYCALRPLYIRKGRSYVDRVLQAAAALRSYGKLARAFPQDRALLDTLLDHGILVSDEPSQAAPLPGCTPQESPGSARQGMSVYLLTSQSCNMGCVYCLNGKRTYRTDAHLKMGAEVAFQSVKKCLESLASGGALEVIFFGGEPLLNWPLVKAVISYCEQALQAQYADKACTYHITSNLSVLPGDLVDWARKYRITFLCDLDGPAPIHDACRPFRDGRPSHATITTNVQRLVAAGLHVALRATITAANEDALVTIAEHHKAMGGRSSAFVPVNPVTSDEDILGDHMLPSPQKVIQGMAEVYRSGLWEASALYPFNQYAPRLVPGARMVFGCGAPCGQTLVVDAKGDTYPCHYLVGISRFHLGNILTDSYPDDTVLRRMRDCLHVDRLDDCKACPWRYICGGGCPVGRLTVVNNPRATPAVKAYWRHISCDYPKRMMELVVWDTAERVASRLLGDQATRETLGVGGAAHCQ